MKVYRRARVDYLKMGRWVRRCAKLEYVDFAINTKEVGGVGVARNGGERARITLRAGAAWPC